MPTDDTAGSWDDISRAAQSGDLDRAWAGFDARRDEVASVEAEGAIAAALTLGAAALDRDAIEIAGDAFQFARERAKPSDAQAQTDAWLGLARVALSRGDGRAAKSALDVAWIYGQRLGDVRRLAQLGRWQGTLSLFWRQDQRAEEELRAARRRAGELGDAPLRSAIAVALGNTLIEQGELDEAEALLNEASAGSDTTEDVWTRFAALRGLSRVARARGSSADAERWEREAESVYGDATPLIMEAESNAIWAAVLHATGHRDEAARLRQMAVILARVAGAPLAMILGQGAWATTTRHVVRGDVEALHLDDVLPDDAARLASVLRERAFELLKDGRQREARLSLGAAERFTEIAGVRQDLLPSMELALRQIADPTDRWFREGWDRQINVFGQVRPEDRAAPTDQQLRDFLDRHERYRELKDAHKAFFANAAAGHFGRDSPRSLTLAPDTVNTYRSQIIGWLGVRRFEDALIQLYRDYIVAR